VEDVAVPEELPDAAKSPEIVDPNNVPVVYVDWAITGGLHDGTLNVSLGTIDHSLNPPDVKQGRVIVASRLRCSQAFATRLHQILGEILNGPAPTPDAPLRNFMN
jgi:hypothetical protein